MDKIFIGWSGNKELADKLASEFTRAGKYKPIVGGGTPKNMYLGAQVIEQIDDCDAAILLVELKDGDISLNLMFEWGYLVSRLTPQKINVVLINIPKSRIPTDVLGVWLDEKTLDRTADGAEEELASMLYRDFEERYETEQEFNYFDIIDGWSNYFPNIDNKNTCTDREMCSYIIFGCLAAYYYGDNESLKQRVSSLRCTDDALASVVIFAKAYIDVFIYSKNMIAPLTQSQCRDVCKVFASTLKRKRGLTKKLDAFLDILCYDARGLAASLYLKNSDIDAEYQAHYEAQAKSDLDTVIQLLDEFETQYPDNGCVVQLIKAYIYNDSAKLYRRLGEIDIYRDYLELSVRARKALHDAVQTRYPNNRFLIEKMEQEYTIANSDCCKHNSDPIEKRENKEEIEEKLEKWRNDLETLGSLIMRIEKNLAEIQ